MRIDKQIVLILAFAAELIISPFVALAGLPTSNLAASRIGNPAHNAVRMTEVDLGVTANKKSLTGLFLSNFSWAFNKFDIGAAALASQTQTSATLSQTGGLQAGGALNTPLGKAFVAGSATNTRTETKTGATEAVGAGGGVKLLNKFGDFDGMFNVPVRGDAPRAFTLAADAFVLPNATLSGRVEAKDGAFARYMLGADLKVLPETETVPRTIAYAGAEVSRNSAENHHQQVKRFGAGLHFDQGKRWHGWGSVNWQRDPRTGNFGPSVNVNLGVFPRFQAQKR
jgi:hypothetical protein